MELENATIIDFGEIELLAVREPMYVDNRMEAKFKINWGKLKQAPETLICFKTDYDKLTKEIMEKNLKYIDIREDTKRELIKILEKEINTFIGKNINNISYFFENEERVDLEGKKYNFMKLEFLDISDIGTNILENEDSIENKANHFTKFENFNEIASCKLKYKSGLYGTDVIEVDLKGNKILTENYKIMSSIYSESKLKKILAYKQYQLGIAPNFYKEIARINEFLKNKKTITVVLKNGDEKRIDADITNIINFYDGEFCLCGSGLDIPYVKRDKTTLNISNLMSIKHGKSEIKINTGNLKPLREQLDEIITKNEKGIICNVNEQELELENY